MAPWSIRLAEGLTLLFAAWTFSCHQSVLFGGSLLHALGLCLLVIVGGGVLLRRWGREGMAPTPRRARDGVPVWARAAALLTGLSLLWSARGDPLDTWWAVAAVLVMGGALTSRLEEPAPPREPTGPGGERFVWLLALCCGLLALVLHRPDLDDSLYLNLAVAAADAPASALLQHDTVHGIRESPLFLPVYRAHSYELMMGAVSLLTRLPVQYCFHFLGTFVFAGLIPIAWAALFKELLPRHWRAALATLMLILLLVGETHRWYSNFGIYRIWQGKAVLLSVMSPLVVAYSLRLGARPTFRRGLLAAAAQISAVGLSSSGLWIAPVAGLTGLASALRGGRRLLGLAAVACAYPLVVGIGLRSELQYVAQRVDASAAGAVRLGEALDLVLGTGPVRLVSLAAIALAWTVTSPGLARRLAAIGPGAVWLTLLNPYLSSFVAANVTGPAYWRALWALPVPLCLTLLLVAPLRLRAAALARGVWFVATASLVAATDVHAPTTANDVRIGFPTLKVPRLSFEAASQVVELTPPGARVAAAPEVSAWIPTFHRHPHPLMVREYLRHKDDEYPARVLVTRLVSTCHYLPPTLSCRPFTQQDGPSLGRALDDLEVLTVCLRLTGRPPELASRAVLRPQGPLRQLLYERGFEPRTGAGPYEVWTRDAVTAAAR